MGQTGRTKPTLFRIHYKTARFLEEIRYSLRLSSDTEALEVAVLLARDFAKGMGIAVECVTPRHAIMQAADLVGVGKGRHGNAFWAGEDAIRAIAKEPTPTGPTHPKGYLFTPGKPDPRKPGAAKQIRGAAGRNLNKEEEARLKELNVQIREEFLGHKVGPKKTPPKRKK